MGVLSRNARPKKDCGEAADSVDKIQSELVNSPLWVLVVPPGRPHSSTEHPED